MLFIVPWLAAGITSGSAFDSAPRTASTMRCDVSTFPAATARGGPALTTVRSGSVTVTGRNSRRWRARRRQGQRTVVDGGRVTAATALMEEAFGRSREVSGGSPETVMGHG
jgi:hypothetical protein